MRFNCIFVVAIFLALGAAREGAAQSLTNRSFDFVLEGDDPGESFTFNLPGNGLAPVVARFEGYFQNLDPLETGVRYDLSWTGPTGGAVVGGIHPDFTRLPGLGQLPVSFEQSIGFTPATVWFSVEGGGPADHFRFVGELSIRQGEPPPEWLWAKPLTGTRSCWGERRAATAVRGGDIFFAAGFSGVASFETTNLTAQGDNDLFLAKLDASGNAVWVRHAPGEPGSYVRWVSVDLDSATNIYLAGRFSGVIHLGSMTVSNQGENAFLAKHDRDGNVLWVWQGNGGERSFASAVAVAPDDTVYLSGHFDGCMVFRAGDPPVCGEGDAFLARFASGGELLWHQRIGGYGGDGVWRWQEANGLALDANGNVYVTGAASHETAFGTLADLPQTNLVSGGSSDIFVAKYGPTGLLAWVRQAGCATEGPDEDDPFDYGRSAAVDAAGNVYVAGRFAGDGPAFFGPTNLTGGGFFLAKYDTDGHLQWVRKSADPGTIQGTRVRLGAGGVYVSREYYLGGPPPNAVLLLQKYDSAGNLLWSQAASAGSYPSSLEFSLLPDESILLAGHFYQQLRLGNFSFTNSNTCDLFFARLASSLPRLSIALAADTVILAWPVSAQDFALQSTDNLASLGWQPVNGTAETNGLWRTVTVVRSNANQFYRLRSASR